MVVERISIGELIFGHISHNQNLALMNGIGPDFQRIPLNCNESNVISFYRNLIKKNYTQQRTIAPLFNPCPSSLLCPTTRNPENISPNLWKEC
jgi:hypothetical protein